MCGITFKSLDDFLIVHVGPLWEEFKSDYPKCQEKEPLPTSIEQFTEIQTPVHQVQLMSVPPMPRLWFVTEDETRLIQVQRDRFIHNWKKMKDNDEYPRYPKVIEMFRETLECFERFLDVEQLGRVEALQYELSYVNHITRHEGWDNLAGIGTLFPDFAWRDRTGRFLPEPESLNLRTTFPLPRSQGRLHVSIQNAYRNDDQQDIIRLDLSVRGIGVERSRTAMYEWFGTAREWIVRGFADITGEEVQKENWRRK